MKNLTQNLRAPNDTNGNPRRLWVIYNTETGEIVSVRDEGYRGRPDRTAMAELVELPSVEIAASEYRAWVRLAKERNIWRAS